MTWSESIKRSLTSSLVGASVQQQPSSEHDLSTSGSSSSVGTVDAEMSKENNVNNHENDNNDDNDNDTIDTDSTACSLASLDEEDYYAHALIEMDMDMDMEVEGVSSSSDDHEDDNDSHNIDNASDTVTATDVTAGRGGLVSASACTNANASVSVSASSVSVGRSLLRSLRISRAGAANGRPRADSLAESLASLSLAEASARPRADSLDESLAVSSLAASVTNSQLDSTLLPEEIRLQLKPVDDPSCCEVEVELEYEYEYEYHHGDDNAYAYEDDMSTIYSHLSTTAPRALKSSASGGTSCVIIIPSSLPLNEGGVGQEEEKQYYNYDDNDNDTANDNITDCVDATVFATDDLTLSTRYLLPQRLRTKRYEQKCRQEQQRLSLKLEEEAQQLLLEDLQSTRKTSNRTRRPATNNIKTTSTIRVGLRVQIEKLMCWKHIHILPKGLFTTRKNEETATTGLQRSSKGVLV